jgi:phenylalanyl-tRNA synthetase beta subunit
MKIAYDHLVKRIKENPSIQEISKNLLQLGHEHEIEGNLFNMEFTPNRGDCLSVNGLLRDLAVFYTIDFNQEIYDKELDNLDFDFENLAEEVCPSITFLKLEIDKIPKKYNQNLNDYFTDLNLKKNNFFTDISNYISYETGQPTHCYDAEKINGKLIFNELVIDEEFETLLDKKINLSKKNAVFILNDQVINLAGVVGGKNTSCSSKTKTVLVECAFFKPEAIIGKSLKYDIQSEAAHKFERFVDPECHDRVLRRFIKIVSEHANIKDLSVFSLKSRKNKTVNIPINENKINQILGVDISKSQYIDYLSKLGFVLNNDEIKVPSFRNDISTQNDLAEEVARLIGYDNICRSELTIPRGKISSNYDIENKLRYFLLDEGFYEVINSPFVGASSNDSIKIDNPLDSNKEFMRINLIDSLIDNLTFNERRQKDSIKLFEISDVYSLDDNQIKKSRRLAIIASGRAGHNHEDFSKQINKKYLTEKFNQALPSETFNFYSINRDSLNTKIKNDIVGCEIDINSFSQEVLKYKEESKSPKTFNQYSPVSDLPYSKRDLSFSIKDYSSRRVLEKYIMEFDDELLKEVFVFDYFFNEKKAEIKIGFRFIFQSKNTTITETQVNELIGVIINHTEKIKGVTIPGLN